MARLREGEPIDYSTDRVARFMSHEIEELCKPENVTLRTKPEPTPPFLPALPACSSTAVRRAHRRRRGRGVRERNEQHSCIESRAAKRARSRTHKCRAGCAGD